MDLQKIREISEKRGKTIRTLALEINKSEQNIHRCIRENKISANDLEIIAKVLQVPISIFFSENKLSDDQKNIFGDGNQVIVGSKNHNIKSNANSVQELELCKQKIEHLEKELESKNEIINLLKNR